MRTLDLHDIEDSLTGITGTTEEVTEFIHIRDNEDGDVLVYLIIEDIDEVGDATEARFYIGTVASEVAQFYNDFIGADGASLYEFRTFSEAFVQVQGMMDANPLRGEYLVVSEFQEALTWE